jgi:antitoxin (DNA-binding transcriptional repressor) of toxin-antitoxin stability system
MFLVHNVTMIKRNIAEAKTHLSRDLALVEKGEVLVLCRRNVPVAEVRRVDDAPKEPRKLGLGAGLYPGWTLLDSFDDPLPDWLLDAFEGKDPEGREG